MSKGGLSTSIFAIVLLLATASVLYYFGEVDRAAAELEVSQVKLRQGAALLETKRQVLSECIARSGKNKQLQLQIRSAEGRLAQASQLDADAETRRRAFESRLRFLSAEVKNRATANRTHLLGADVREVRLASGRVLNRFRLRKLEGPKCFYTCSTGLGVVDVSELPASLRSYLDVGPTAIAAQLRQWQEILGLVSPVVAESDPDTGALRVIQNRIARVEARIAVATAHKDSLQGEVSELDQKINQAMGRGGQTFNLRTLRDVAEGSAGMARNELAKLEAELTKLRLEEERLLAERH